MRGNPEITRGAIFSEGRALRVRVARPHECRGIPFSPDDEAKGPWPPGHTPRSSQCLPYGGAEPAPPPGDGPRRELSGKELEMTRKVIFSEGRGPRARVGRPDASRGMSLPDMAIQVARGLMGTCLGQPRGFLAGVQSPPLQGGKPSMDGPAGETPKMTPREFFGRGLQSLIVPRLFHFGAQDLGFSCLRRPICKFPFWIPGQNSGGSLSPRGARVVPSRSLQPERARDWI